MEQKLLFNPKGTDDLENRRIIGGNTTNIFNLNNIKYNWATELYRVMSQNFWLPEKVDLSLDVQNYSQLTDAERTAYNGILSFLVFLDSIQTNNVPFISNYITSPEVNIILGLQTYQEAIHSQSYGYIIDTIIPKEMKNTIYDYWRIDQILFDRNRLIAATFQDFRDNPSDDNFKKVVISNYLLEGLYFYNGFMFFYLLASRNLMPGTADIVKYINKDELTHVALFRNIMNTCQQEFPGFFREEEIVYLTKQAVDIEINWTNHIIGNQVLGINPTSTDKYTKYRANLLMQGINIKPLYPEATTNPYPHLEKIADLSGEAAIKSNFFEATVTSYQQSTVVTGWDF